MGIPGTVGILPAGALGVAFFHHLTLELRVMDGTVYFLEREGSASGAAFRAAAILRVVCGDAIHEVRENDLFAGDLRQCADAGRLPEVLLVCTQPDQLLGVISSWVQVFEGFVEKAVANPIAELPLLVLTSNGIYFQRVRQFLIEKLEESTLLGRLPDLWPEAMPAIIGKLVRGVTIQTGQREGSGPEAIYRPGPRGRTRLAGGDRAHRHRCAELLSERGGWFESVEDLSPTRVEFDKALINLAANLFGQLASIDDAGRFTALSIAEIFVAEQMGELRELVERVVEVGRAVHAYRAGEDVEAIYENMLGSIREYAAHIPSSLQWIASELRRGTLIAKLPPTERWLVEPLIRYAHATGLETAAEYFERLTERVEARLALAVERREAETSTANRRSQ